jgi:hypothetical protein
MRNCGAKSFNTLAHSIYRTVSKPDCPLASAAPGRFENGIFLKKNIAVIIFLPLRRIVQRVKVKHDFTASQLAIFVFIYLTKTWGNFYCSRSG